MNNTFKHIFATIAFSSAALVSGIGLDAQNLPEGVYLEAVNKDGKPAGIAYRKAAQLKPGSTDTYTVNLEAFVTGQVTMEQVSKPADIVLVLDVSGSMDEHMYSYIYNARKSDSYSYRGLRGKNYYYKHTDGNYYAVNRLYGYSGYNTFYTLGYTISDGTTYFLSGTGTTTTLTADDVVWRENDIIWTGVLYEREIDEDLGTKMENLQYAVCKFIDKIHENDLYEKDEEGNLVRRKGKSGADTTLGNQIAIVKFAMDDYVNSNASYNSDNAPITEGDHDMGGYSRYNYTEVIKSFTKTGTDANVSSLKNAVNGLHAAGATAGDYGLNLARLLLKNLPASRQEGGENESGKTVVFFTDGSPTYGSDFSSTVANQAISNSFTIKNTYDAQVFSIGVFSDLGDDAQNVEKYMNRVSSNYKNSKNIDDGDPITPPSARVYYQNASDADLTAVFETVAQASGGSGSSIGESSVVTIDVVASSFNIPSEAANLSVTVAPCEGKTQDPGEPETIGGQKVRKLYLKFGEAKKAEDYGLPTITIETGKNKDQQDTVATKNFNFSEHWCGYDEEHTKWHGYKQIISFDVKVNDTAVGGPTVATNDGKSGLYVDGEPLIHFNRPNVELPISIWIVKKGLIGDDSAVFNIQYAEYKDDVDPRDLPEFVQENGTDKLDENGNKIPTWKSFTKVMVNANSPKYTINGVGYPIAKLVGLSPKFFYRIKEDAWAWTYKYVTGGDAAHQKGGRLYIFGEDQKNPFVFENKSDKDNKVKEHEATVKNVFGADFKVVSSSSSSSTTTPPASN